MLSLETEHGLARLLFTLAECERSMEKNRQDLCSDPNFNLYSTFLLIDSKNKKNLTALDLASFLKTIKHKILKKNLRLLIKQYDLNNDSKLNIEEFQAVVLPCEDLDLNREVLSRNIFFVTDDVKESLGRHLELECIYLSRLERLRKRLADRTDFNLIAAFRSVDFNQVNSINVLALREFLKNNGFSVTTQELNAIIRRIDRDNDSKINFDEFSEFFSLALTAPKAIPKFNPSTKPCFVKSSMKSLKNSVSCHIFGAVPLDHMKSMINLFVSQISLDYEIEQQRLSLYHNPDFCVLDFFRLIDTHNKNWIHTRDFELILHDLRIPYKIEEVFLMINRFSSYKDSIIRFSDFKRMFVTRNKIYARVLKERSTGSSVADGRLKILKQGVIGEIQACFRTILQCETAAEDLRRDISSKNWIDFYKVFNEIDKRKNGYIYLKNFQEVLERFGHMPSRAELSMLIERYDKDLDKRVSYIEFIEEITPRKVR